MKVHVDIGECSAKGYFGGTGHITPPNSEDIFQIAMILIHPSSKAFIQVRIPGGLESIPGDAGHKVYPG